MPAQPVLPQLEAIPSREASIYSVWDPPGAGLLEVFVEDHAGSDCHRW
jgi:hypothetical protein